MLLQLLALLILCAAVRGKEVECDQVHYDYNCWTSENNYFNYCGICVINNQEVSNSDEVLLISNTHENGTVADVEFVRFHGGEIAKMSKIIHKTNSKQILQVQLWETKTQVLNEQFFGNAAENLTQFKSLENNLSVKDFAFQNCKNLEHLDLSHNKITSIAPNAFRGLQKLIQLNLSANELSSMLNGWFYELGNLEVLDLGANQLEEIPKNSFNSLIRLKELFLFTNRIEIISKNLFKHNEQLQTINLWDNKIKQIQSGSFAHLNQLTELTLGRNECTNQKFIHKTPEEIAKGLTACYPKTESACVIPQISNGHIVSIDDNLTQVPGDFFESTGSVKVVCNSSFIQIHDKANQTTNRCVKDKWEDFQWPTCHRLCPRQEITDSSFSALCDRDGEDFPCSGNLLPGTRAIIRCKAGFRNPKGLVNPKMTCEESGNWNQSAHKCEPISKNTTQPSEVQSGVSCSYQEISDISILTYCERDEKDIPCTDHLPPGTTATIRCHFGYKEPTKVNSLLICNSSGKWNRKAFKCEPICGKVASHSVPLQIGGKDTNVTEVPWHVGIYQSDTQICGGTIISERVVISAAHCFSQSINGMHKIDYKSFKVAAGKIVRGLYENETQETQIRDVLGVEISHKYDGMQKWWADIAAIIIKGHFEYYQHIVPACVHFIKNRDDWYPKNDSSALVAGWGLNKDFLSSDILQSFNIPVVDFDSCREKASEEFQDKVVEDKICAGYVDPNGQYSRVVCKGDSGGGLLIPQMVKNKKRYYLQGVVSNSQMSKDACDTSFYTLFTNIQYYKNPIIKALNMT